MKLSFFIGIIILTTWACSPVKVTSKPKATLVHSQPDSARYEILITDPGFEQWYQLNYTPAKDRLNDYYRSKNLAAASSWNYYFTTGQYRQIIDSSIDYRPEIDYGIDVNRKLYWYFVYAADKYKIRLFSTGESDN